MKRIILRGVPWMSQKKVVTMRKLLCRCCQLLVQVLKLVLA